MGRIEYALKRLFGRIKVYKNVIATTDKKKARWLSERNLFKKETILKTDTGNLYILHD